MEIELFIANQPLDRQKLLSEIHAIILASDPTVTPIVEPMMGKEMIIYKGKGVMKYGLASVKNYMSLHLLPIYGSKALHSKYKALLNKASFQKGCINFNQQEEMPLDIVQQLIVDCSSIDLLKMREEYMNSKKSK